MNPATATVVTAGVVTLGKWSTNEPLNIRIVAGGMVLAVGLAVLSEGNADLGSKFATLITLVAVFTYAPAIAWKLGLLDHAKYPAAPKWV